VDRCKRLGALTCVLAAVLAASACAHWVRKVPPATVVFDEAHGQRFLVEEHGPLDLSGLAAVAQEQGLLVKTSRQDISDNALSGVDALVISGPFAPLLPAEIDATLRFLNRGGRLCVMLHIGSPAAALLAQLNVAISNGVIRERENLIADYPLNFHVTRLTPHDLTRQLDGFDAFGVWALMNLGDNAAIIAQTSPSAWVDLNGNQALDAGDAVQSFGVAVAGTFGKGRFVVFGDDAIFQNKFLIGGNAVLAKNLARWLGAAVQVDPSR
jgi:hypothetical protein